MWTGICLVIGINLSSVYYEYCMFVYVLICVLAGIFSNLKVLNLHSLPGTTSSALFKETSAELFVLELFHG
jgi:hypothetical protein